MLSNLRNKTALAAVALALGLSPGPAALAENESDVTTQPDTQIERKTQDKTAEKRAEILAEATSAIRETENALKALDGGERKAAIAALERATGKLEIILARDPELALAPSGISTMTYDVLAGVETVRALRERAEDALEDGRVQEARSLIRNLASETVISTTNIPLATYPDAIKLAARLIDEEKPEEAKWVLNTALNTLVITDVVIPLPVATAEYLLEQAETLAEKDSRGKQENERLASFLNTAREQLEFAEALGYGSEEDFEALYQELEKIEERTDAGKHGEGFFDRIRGFLENTVTSSQPGESVEEDSDSTSNG